MQQKNKIAGCQRGKLPNLNGPISVIHFPARDYSALGAAHTSDCSLHAARTQVSPIAYDLDPELILCE